MDTGDVIRILRKRDKVSMQEMADYLMVTPASIKKYENGGVQNLKLATIQSLCKMFKVPPLAFVFPDVWNRSRNEDGKAPDFYKYTAIYSSLTEEGKQKVLAYVEDIGKIDCYIREEIQDIEGILQEGCKRK